MAALAAMRLCAAADDGAYSMPIVDEFVKDARVAYALPEYAAYTNTLLRTGKYRNRGADSGLPKRDAWAPGRVRWIDVGGVRNVRDIGGWTGLRTGMVFRGGELDSDRIRKPDPRNPDKKAASYGRITPAGLTTLREGLRIRTDLDLRKDFGLPSGLGADVKHVVIPISAYTNMLRGAERVAACLRVFADPENYPVYVHCAGGADRTGSILFLLEGLCGVPEPDLNIEYELTTFGLAERSRMDKPYYFASLVKRMKTCPGANLNEQIAWYVEHDLGLAKDEIAAIRRSLMPVR